MTSGYFSIMGNLDWCMPEIIKRLPLYKRSVEVCCGRGELIWHTRVPKEEIMNDKDPDIVRIHRFVQNVTYSELIDFQRNYDWILSKETFNHVINDFEENDDFDFAYKFLYVLGGGVRGTMSTHFFQPREGIILNSPSRIKDIKPRLRDTELTNLDGIDCIKKHDSADTFLFIDPPYPSRESYYAVSNLDWRKLYEVLKDAKSNWMLVFDPHVSLNYKGIRKKDLSYVKRCERVAKQFIDEYPHISLRAPLAFQQQFKTWKFNRDYKEYFIVCNYEIPDIWKPEDAILTNW